MANSDTSLAGRDGPRQGTIGGKSLNHNLWIELRLEISESLGEVGTLSDRFGRWSARMTDRCRLEPPWRSLISALVTRDSHRPSGANDYAHSCPMSVAIPFFSVSVFLSVSLTKPSSTAGVCVAA